MCGMRQGAKEAMKRELDCTSAAKHTCWYELFTLARAAFICSVAHVERRVPLNVELLAGFESDQTHATSASNPTR